MDKKNIVIILADQLRAQSLGCYGNQDVGTPNIDQLARDGFRFDQMISNCPVCMPARSALLSGQYTRRCTGNLNNHHLIDKNGQWFFPDPPERVRTQLLDKTLPEYLKEAGYTNKLIGKWHVHPEPRLLGFDSWCYPMVYHRYYQQGFFEGSTAYIIDDFAPFFEAEKVNDFLTSHDKETPFFLFYNISLPHMPLGQIPEHYEELYDPESIKLRKNVTSIDPQLDEIWFENYMNYYYQNHKIKIPERFLRDLDIKKVTSLYNAFVTITDTLIGQLMQNLERAGFGANTLLLFTSDHGDMLGSHGLYNKSQLYEEAVRVPLIMKGPEIEPGVNTEQIVQTIDLMPTILDYCGLTFNESSVDGQSLYPILKNKKTSLACNHAFIECTNYKIGIRTPRYTYGVQVDPESLEVTDDAMQFYDLEEDPYQEQNRAGIADPQLQSISKNLKEKVIRWHEETPWLDNPFRYLGITG
jgi:arylsulfatase A-like enzyme